MKKIKLTKGKYALVDDDCYEELSKYTWRCGGGSGRGRGYAVRAIKVNGRMTSMLMHRQIMRPPEGLETDHINGDRLDNRRDNLRVCTRAENSFNRTINGNNTSGYKGVYWYEINKRWGARIAAGRKQIFLGLFANKEEAARAYDEAARRLHGEFARLNF